MKYHYIVGIDQSFSNTGVAVLDIQNKKIIELKEIKAGPLKPDLEDYSDYFNIERDRVRKIHGELRSVLDKYPVDQTLVCIEYLASGSTVGHAKSKDTDYVLAYLFYSTIDFLDQYGVDRIPVSPLSHKKIFFPVAKGSKKDLYEEHWDTCFADCGFEVDLELNFKSLDLKDAFCLAFFGYIRQRFSIDQVFAYRTIKERNTRQGRTLEALKSNICFETKKAKLCWRCPIYLSCTDKKKYKLPKTKKDRAAFDNITKLNENLNLKEVNDEQESKEH